MIHTLERASKFVSFPQYPIDVDVVRLTRPRDPVRIEPLLRRGSAAFSGQDYLPTGQLMTKPPEMQRATADIWTGFIAVAMSCMVYSHPVERSQGIYQSKALQIDQGTLQPSSVAPVVALVDDAQKLSGLTLDLIAPLLGVSRRSIHYWKDDSNISLKNELLLRDLVDALKKISTGNADATRDLLLARIIGVPRIYDLLAERRYEKAIARAKDTTKLKPILSDQTLKFNGRPIADQLAFSDDGPAKPMGKLNRSVSRRIVR